MLIDAHAAEGQVHVEARLEKSSYIAGEPIFVIADVTNNYAEPIAYDDGLVVVGGTSMSLEVQWHTRRALIADRIANCPEFLVPRLPGATVDHPPVIASGATQSFRYLLTDYDLPPGKYTLRAVGRVNLRWKFYPTTDSRGTPTPMARALDGRPMNGGAIDRTFSLVVEAGSAASLARAYAPHLEWAERSDTLESTYARRVILALAPPSLENAITRYALEGMARGDGFGYLGVEALARIGTTSSRAALRDALRAAKGEGEQAAAVRALSAAATSEDTPFLTSLMTDGARPERVRSAAALGLGRTGSANAIRTLAAALQNATPESDLARSIIAGLSLSKSPLGVKALIDAAARATNAQLGIGIRGGGTDICHALATLTHYRWCEGSRTRDAVVGRWSKWWDAHGAAVQLFGNDACVLEERMPVLPE